MKDYLKILDYNKNFSFTSALKLLLIALAVALVGFGVYKTVILQAKFENAFYTSNKTANDNNTYEEMAEKSVLIEETPSNTIYLGSNRTKVVFQKTTLAELEADGSFIRNTNEPLTAHDGIVFYKIDDNRSYFDIRYYGNKRPFKTSIQPEDCIITGLDIGHTVPDTSFYFKYDNVDNQTDMAGFIEAFGSDKLSYTSNADKKTANNFDIDEKTFISVTKDTYGDTYNQMFTFSIITYFDDPTQ